jgi:hypothetical protein
MTSDEAIDRRDAGEEARREAERDWLCEKIGTLRVPTCSYRETGHFD